MSNRPERERWTNGIARRWGERLHAGLHAEVLADPDAVIHNGRAHAVAFVCAVFIDLTTLGLVGFGLWIMWIIPFRIGGVVIGGILILVAWDVRPRLAKLPNPLRAQEVTHAPALQAYLADVAEAVGTRTVDHIYVTRDLNAAVFDAGLPRKRVLVIGAPLWAVLSPGQRTAVLGHEFGHFVSGDTRRSTLVSGAISTLLEWHQLMRDDRTVGISANMGGLAGLATWVARWVLRILSVLPQLAAWGLFSVTQRDSQRAEYRADRIAARVAGRADAIDAIGTLMRLPHVALELSRATAARADNLLDAAVSFIAVDTPPPRDDRPPDTFASHPPTHLRLEALEHLPALEPMVASESVPWALIDSELAPAMTKAERWLRDSFR